MTSRAVRFALRAGQAGGAVAIIDVQGACEQLDRVLAAIGAHGVRPGDMRVRTLAGADQALVARITPSWAQLMCHDGPAVLSAVRDALERTGAMLGSGDDPRERFREASSLLEACVLDALARAASPRAVDLLLAQPARWAGAGWLPGEVELTDRDRVLHRLIDPPTVATVGAANVGKSTLLNALAGRSVALAADEPGVTRDHVGALLDLGGLVVWWVDTPGLGVQGRPVDAAAAEAAWGVAGAADVILHCADADGFGRLPIEPRGHVIRVATRADQGESRGAEVITAAGAPEPRGLEALTEAVGEALTPRSALESERPWVFHEALARPEKGKAEPK